MLVEPLVKGVALDRNPARLADRPFQGCDRLALRRFAAGHVENFLLLDRPVQVVDAETQRDLGQRQAEADPVGGDVVEVVKVEPRDGEVASRNGCSVSASSITSQWSGRVGIGFGFS